jgi:hypothetical protein
MLTFHAAARKIVRISNGGFQMENALSREETLRGMTMGLFYLKRKEKGSLKLANGQIL